jgi:hypothetical protein
MYDPLYLLAVGSPASVEHQCLSQANPPTSVTEEHGLVTTLLPSRTQY